VHNFKANIYGPSAAPTLKLITVCMLLLFLQELKGIKTETSDFGVSSDA
jgi:hypothetical protein